MQYCLLQAWGRPAQCSDLSVLYRVRCVCEVCVRCVMCVRGVCEVCEVCCII